MKYYDIYINPTRKEGKGYSEYISIEQDELKGDYIKNIAVNKLRLYSVNNIVFINEITKKEYQEQVA